MGAEYKGMKEKQKKVLIIEVNNVQCDYARCLELINYFEKKGTILKEKEVNICSIVENLKVYLGEVIGNIAPNYYEQPLIISSYIDGEKKNASYQMNNKVRIDSLNLKTVNAEYINYHVRVHMASEEKINLANLQYLALMLKRLEYLFVEKSITQKKISVFIVPRTASKYPFKNEKEEIDTEIYELGSQYLRLLSKQYTGVIYGYTNDKSDYSVKALDFKKGKKFEDYFPLLPIEWDDYEKILQTKITKIDLIELFALKKKQRFREANNKDPKRAYIDFIAETSFRKIQDSLEKLPEFLKEEIIQYILEKIINEKENNWLFFALFAFVFRRNEENEKEYILENINDCWKLVNNIAKGLRQIIQNAVQHSELKMCFLSFYLHKTKCQEENQILELLEKKYKGVKNKFKYTNNEEILEILVSDLNEKQTMIDTFVTNLEEEKKLLKKEVYVKAHDALIRQKDHIAIRNFFSVFEDGDLKQEWEVFRQNDLAAHLGLSLFALTVERCNAVVQVTSTNSSLNLIPKLHFYNLNREEKEVQSKNIIEQFIIPGTQISLLIPTFGARFETASGLGKIENYAGFREDYKSFAQFLDYSEQRFSIKRYYFGEKEIEPSYNRIHKFELTQKWIKFWEDYFNKHILKKDNLKIVYNIDFEKICSDTYFSNNDNIEVCVKGLISGLESFENCRENIFMAFTNTSKEFASTFRNISILFGVKKFPQNLQLCISDITGESFMILFGRDYEEAIYHSYLLSLGHGVKSFQREEYNLTREIKKKFLLGNISLDTYNIRVQVFPFDVVLSCAESNKNKIFERRIEQLAENSLEQRPYGYKLSNTHMRLGSKVHIEAFYEMSFLFYRTNIANRVAFLIIQKLIKESQINILEDTVIFYGYASYSKAILTSLTEILKLYRLAKVKEEKKNRVLPGEIGFASYQHNLQSESEDIQMYFGFSQDFSGKISDKSKVIFNKDVSIVQIVPISSTLTTFEKMWDRFWKSVDEPSKVYVTKRLNYTIFWVSDSQGYFENGEPSGIEKDYWRKVVISDKKIETRFGELNNKNGMFVEYFMHTSVVWHDPLECKLCYPDDVIEEVPIVETDTTSTVPAQQIRWKMNTVISRNEKFHEINNRRLLKLENCISYGHICRRNNHYQYYINTQKYFYEVRKEVKVWLETIKEKQTFKRNDYPELHIIFSPEHNTNVGFAQYVNTYYFNGCAEIVSLNVDKQFRTNFKCEHAGLIQTIYQLNKNMIEQKQEYVPVKFYFVDDTITTGATYEKANNFLHSLITKEFQAYYSANLIDKCFLLIDRLSNETKNMYVNDIENNFLSFVHIDISNTRNQGDSCVGCKLEQDAKKLFKRSATKNTSDYWADKIENYQVVAYDAKRKMKKYYNEDAFHRMLISHIVQNTVIVERDLYELGIAYDVILDLSLYILRRTKTLNSRLYEFESLLENISGIEDLINLIKIVSRPFFSYDFKIRLQVMTFLILLTELLVDNEQESCIVKIKGSIKDNELKKFLLFNGRIEKTLELVNNISNKINSKEKRLEFIQDGLLESLVDLRSTYIMRKVTLKKMYLFIDREISQKEQKTLAKNFWKKYASNLYRLIDCNADESKALWMEYLYLSGFEYREFQRRVEGNRYSPRFFYTELTEDKNREKTEFYKFCHEIFIQNTGINFDGIEKFKKNRESVDKYFMEQWRRFQELSQFKVPEKIFNRTTSVCPSKEEIEFFTFFMRKKRDINSVDSNYEMLIQIIGALIEKKYNIGQNDMNIALLTDEGNAKSAINNRMLEIDILMGRLACEMGYQSESTISQIKYEIKENLIHAIGNKQDTGFDLEEYGYTIWENLNKKEAYIIVFFDNPEKDIEFAVGRRLNKLAKVYLYLSFRVLDIEKSFFYSRYILRDILTYRNRILTMLERDFSGNVFSKYAHTLSERNILAHEKANSHTTTSDDVISLEVFVEQKGFKGYKNLDSSQTAQWLLLRNYTNNQIAKIFNRVFGETNGRFVNAPPLYLDEKFMERGEKNRFKQCLKKFSDMEIISDQRFKLIDRIANVDYNIEWSTEFVKNQEGKYINLEYFKCILIDIFLSAVKYKSDRTDFLLRIDNFLEIEHMLKHPQLIVESKYEKKRCKIEVRREAGIEVDYLVIHNQVDKLAHDLSDWEYRNQEIYRRLNNPLDYADGHMSLLTIKRYIEKFTGDLKDKPEFEYIAKGTEFVTRLPVLKKEGKDAEKNLLDR